MNFLNWYLNLTFWQAVLVWLKLLLPVLFGLVVVGLVLGAFRLFSGSLKLPKTKLPNLQSNRKLPKPETRAQS